MSKTVVGFEPVIEPPDEAADVAAAVAEAAVAELVLADEDVESMNGLMEEPPVALATSKVKVPMTSCCCRSSVIESDFMAAPSFEDQIQDAELSLKDIAPPDHELQFEPIPLSIPRRMETRATYI